MTTANPGPVSTHPESSDDLIAELARLMAQETPAPRPVAQPAPEAARPNSAPSVRIPGGPTSPVAPAPRGGSAFDFDFGLTPQPKAPERPATPPAPTAPLVSPPSFAASVVARTAAPAPAAAVPVVDDSAIEPQVDDPIAALIAAELDNTFARPSAPPPAVIVPEPPAPSAAPSVAVPQRSEPSADFVPPSPRREETDRFATAPVFGIASRPAQPVTPPSDDPMSEIEGLIGQAVRVELAAPQRVEPRLDAPRSVTTPSAPQALTAPFFARPEAAPPPRPIVTPRPASSVEDTILAAAAATGAEVDLVDDEPMVAPPERGRAPKVAMPKLAMPRVAIPKLGQGRAAARAAEPDVEMEPRRRRGLVRPMIGAGVAAAFLAAAGFGLWTVLGLGQPSGDAPVLTADSAPVKEAPPPAEPSPASTERSLVLDGMAAASDAAPATEQLVSRDQADGTEVSEAVAVAEVEDPDAALASRKVRTITVRPDGSIVNGDAALAGGEVLPVDRPNVPELPATDQVASEMLASAREPGAAPGSPGVAPLALADTSQAAMVSPAPNLSGPVPSTVAVTSDGTEVPYPMPRPAGREYVAAAAPLSPVNAVVADETPVGAVDLMGNRPAATPTPRTTQAAAASPPAVTTANTASAYVQLSSQRSEDAARASANSIRSRFGSLFGDRNLEIQRVDLGEKGIYYRVRLPAGSLNEAANICSSVKANGGDCFALNG